MDTKRVLNAIGRSMEAHQAAKRADEEMWAEIALYRDYAIKNLNEENERGSKRDDPVGATPPEHPDRGNPPIVAPTAEGASVAPSSAPSGDVSPPPTPPPSPLYSQEDHADAWREAANDRALNHEAFAAAMRSLQHVPGATLQDRMWEVTARTLFELLGPFKPHEHLRGRYRENAAVREELVPKEELEAKVREHERLQALCDELEEQNRLMKERESASVPRAMFDQALASIDAYRKASPDDAGKDADVWAEGSP